MNPLLALVDRIMDRVEQFIDWTHTLKCSLLKDVDTRDKYKEGE